MKYDDPFDVNPPFNPYISFTTPISTNLKTTVSKPKPIKKKVVQKQQTRPVLAPPPSKMMKNIMKANTMISISLEKCVLFYQNGVSLVCNQD